MQALYRETGDYIPRPLNNGKKPSLQQEQYDQIIQAVVEKPDISLQEIKDKLQLNVSISTICRAVNGKLGLNRKKTLFSSKSKDKDVAQKREEWKKEQSDMDASKMIFLDERGVNTGTTRLYGRTVGQERVVDCVVDIRYHRTTILSSVRLDGTIVPIVFDGTLNGNVFKAYIERCLIPTLHTGDIVVMDNLSSHKVKGIEEAICAFGATVMYLPAYSPDLNPIELMWGKVKAYLRKVQARTSETLFTSIGEAFSTITISDIVAWFDMDHYCIR